MFNNDQGVAQIAEANERLDEAAVIPLMQADARFVEDVQHSHQSTANLGREANPLRLPTSESPGRPIKRQIVKAHVDEECQPLIDLLEHSFGDRQVSLRA